MVFRYIWLAWLCMPLLSVASADTSHVNEKDLYLGEAFYSACQGNYVDAITRRDIALMKLNKPAQASFDPLHFRIGSSQFSAGDFEWSYRMYRRGERIYKAISEGHADQLVRNEAAYRLARIYLQEDEPENALKSIGNISGEIPEGFHDDELFLRAQIYMANGKYFGAVQPLQELQNSKNYKGFAAYNLGIALIKSGQKKQGLDQLDKAGDISGDDDLVLSIKDKANLLLGYQLMDAKQPALARQYLDRVRLDGPFSNKALLGAGWAEVAQGRFDSALAPWSVLSKRNADDNFVQESMLGVPYVYAQLNLPGKATLLYGEALEGFDKEITRLDASIKSVSDGKFLPALLQAGSNQGGNWIAKFRPLAEAPETRYLFEMMASGDFEESLRNYLDLYDLSERLASWDNDLDAYEKIIVSRRQYYKSLGYDDQVSQLKKRVHDSMQKVNEVMAGQGYMLEMMAMNELNLRRKHLEENQAQAKLALVENYERAKQQAATGGAK
jgi:hypothetical protein